MTSSGRSTARPRRSPAATSTTISYHRIYAIECTVQRSIEVVSEASRGIPAELKARHADVPWSQIAGIGNVLRHDCGIVDPHVLRNIVTVHDPQLRRAVVDLLDRLPDDD